MILAMDALGAALGSSIAEGRRIALRRAYTAIWWTAPLYWYALAGYAWRAALFSAEVTLATGRLDYLFRPTRMSVVSER